MDFPKPQIGFYQAECCLFDLYKIETPEQLDEVEERIADNDECGQLMVFATLKDAVQYLDDDGVSPEEKAREYARLGCKE